MQRLPAETVDAMAILVAKTKMLRYLCRTDDMVAGENLNASSQFLTIVPWRWGEEKKFAMEEIQKTLHEMGYEVKGEITCLARLKRKAISSAQEKTVFVWLASRCERWQEKERMQEVSSYDFKRWLEQGKEIDADTVLGYFLAEEQMRVSYEEDSNFLYSPWTGK